ncbi:undecaprenyl/decaprenyl-phosphate alpha-N-acetylglucosaminyl 1-phosphate transferase [Nonomuraea sp. NBC_01738]|uniref:glycosyltransferase family 4 protein n=1 Tax=Nonomuraea sp. NBC_01738 TaxID=2976003 RepID=UPI002E0EE281|nr:undecaprenyl/decaprenyl-phosphate alpha-N-acetylglucosaminyl 1-phosphate transferase [Nonomuraea sp. NBC_01738]
MALIAAVAGLGLLAFAVTSGCAGPLARVAVTWGLTDLPGGHKTHARPTPYLGGLAMALGTLTAVPAIAGDTTVTAIVAGALAVAVLGLLDDIVPQPPATRLAVETVVAGAVVLNGVCVPLTGTWLDLVLTTAWLVVITNSFNLLDNLDGTLGGVAVTGGSALAATAFLLDRPAAGVLLVVVCGSALGFLRHNWAPAKLFMGDSGSLFLGFVIASCAAVTTSMATPTGAILPVAAGLLLPTLVATVDTAVVVISRHRGGRPLLLGGLDHVAHRLRAAGLGTRLIATSLAFAAGLSGLLALAVSIGLLPAHLALLGAAALGLALAAAPPALRQTRQRRPAGPEFAAANCCAVGARSGSVSHCAASPTSNAR